MVSLRNRIDEKLGSHPKVELISVKMGFLKSIEITMKLSGMRKAQEFTVIKGKDKTKVYLQSDTRIGWVGVDGVGAMSKSYSGGAYFPHLQMGVLSPFEFEPNDWTKVKKELGDTLN